MDAKSVNKDIDTLTRLLIGAPPHTGFEQMTNIVKGKGKTWIVDTNDTPDHGLETMIFQSKSQPETDCRANINYGYIKWSEVYTERYASIEEARTGHERIVANIEQYI